MKAAGKGQLVCVSSVAGNTILESKSISTTYMPRYRHGSPAVKHRAIHDAEMKLFKMSMKGAREQDQEAKTAEAGKVSAGRVFTREHNILNSALKLGAHESADRTPHMHGLNRGPSALVQSRDDAAGRGVRDGLKESGLKDMAHALGVPQPDGAVHDMAHANERAEKVLGKNAGEHLKPRILGTIDLGHSQQLRTASVRKSEGVRERRARWRGRVRARARASVRCFACACVCHQYVCL